MAPRRNCAVGKGPKYNTFWPTAQMLAQADETDVIFSRLRGPLRQEVYKMQISWLHRSVNIKRCALPPWAELGHTSKDKHKNIVKWKYKNSVNFKTQDYGGNSLSSQVCRTLFTRIHRLSHCQRINTPAEVLSKTVTWSSRKHHVIRIYLYNAVNNNCGRAFNYHHAATTKSPNTAVPSTSDNFERNPQSAVCRILHSQNDQ